MSLAARGDGAADHPRVGIIVPHDMALDRELWQWTPPDVSLHLTRTAYTDLPVNTDLALTLGAESLVAPSVRDLSAISPQVDVFGCTCGSFVRGRAGERELVRVLLDAGAADAVTTSGALLEAMAHLGLRRVAVATPYDAELTDLFCAFLVETGELEVIGRSELGLESGVWAVPPETVEQLIVDADRPEAEAVLVACTNLASYDVIAAAETRLGKPVVTANQATMWAALRRVGRAAVGPGQRLLEPTG